MQGLTYKPKVEVLQPNSHLVGHVVVFNSHHNHVEHYESHYRHFKLS